MNIKHYSITEITYQELRMIDMALKYLANADNFKEYHKSDYDIVKKLSDEINNEIVF